MNTLNRLLHQILIAAILLAGTPLPQVLAQPTYPGDAPRPGISDRPAQATTPTLSLVAPAGPQPANQPFDIQLMVANATNLAAFEIDLTFDLTFVQVVGITPGDLLGVGANCTPGAARCAVGLGPMVTGGTAAVGAYSYGSGSGLDGGGLLATLHLTPTGLSGTTPLSLTQAVVADTAAVTVTPDVQGTSLTLAISESVDSNATYLPLIIKQGDTSAVATQIDQTENGPVANSPLLFTAAACLDFTADDKIDAADITAIANRWRENSSNPAWNAAFDLDGDGRITVADIMQVAAVWGSDCPGLNLPPDPVAVASPLDRSVATDFYAATRFLHEGNPPIQTGVVSGTIEPRRASIIRGKVLDLNGDPLPGVTVAILDHPEYGQTLSRADGMYDMVVNGGGRLTVNFQRDGYPPVQRQLDPLWEEYHWLPDVVLTPYDTQVTTVDLTAAGMQVARGSVISDTDGTRQATILFPAGTQAYMTLTDGTTQTLTTLNVRTTEYTVGDNGPQAMPAELPPQSAYTYAVELTVDEVLADGVKVNGKDVIFNQPVPFYVDNFIGFVPGTVVPVGYYDNDRAVWVPAQNGRVIEIVSETNGRADLNIDSDPAAETDSELALWGITGAERDKLASLYEPGQTLWRASLSHFSTYDLNWPYKGAADGAEDPNQPEPRPDDPSNDPCEQDGSIIECQNQVLGERIDLVGTPFTLNYRGNRVPGRTAAYQLDIPLTGPTIPPVIKRVELEIVVAGQLIKKTFQATPNLAYTFTWDGLDAYGRPVQGKKEAYVNIGYVYDGFFGQTADDVVQSQGFATYTPLESVCTATSSQIRCIQRLEVTFWQEHVVQVGPWDARPLGLGGWSLDVHHTYDPSGIIYFGDGRRQDTGPLEYTVETIAGNGGVTAIDNVPGTQSGLNQPYDVIVAPDGSLYIADANNNRIRRVDTDGVITTVAGNGVSAYDPADNGRPATEVPVRQPTGLAFGPDGSLYIAQANSYVVRRVDPDGIITTVAGTGVQGFGGDGGPATQAQLDRPWGIAVGPDGSLLIADSGNSRVRRVGVDGIIRTVAGTGAYGSSGEGGPAVEADLRSPTDVAFGPDGDFFLVDSNSNAVHRVGPDGIIQRVAGGGFSGCPFGEDKHGDGLLATDGALCRPFRVAIGPDETLYIADTSYYRIRQVSPDGIISTLAGTNSRAFNGDGLLARRTNLFLPRSFAVGPDGSFYIADTSNHRVRKLVSIFPRGEENSLIIPAETELYVFDPSGRHLRTLDALTYGLLYQFSYTTDGRLATAEDSAGNITTIEYDSSGQPQAIVGPYGQRTTLGVDANGFLSQVTDPANRQYQFTYNAGGLMQTMQNPRGNSNAFSYDSGGLLVQDNRSDGGAMQLVQTKTISVSTVTLDTAEARSTSYRTETTATNLERRINTFPTGLSAIQEMNADGVNITRLPDGTTTTVQQGADPRWKMLLPLNETVSISTPGGLLSTINNDQSVVLTDPDDPLTLEQRTATTAINGRTYTSLYQAATRITTNTTPTGRQTTTLLDGQGRIVQEQTAGLAPITYSYDSRGRLSAVTLGTGSLSRTTTFGYNGQGYLETITNPLNQTINYSYDAAGQITQQTLPDGRVIGYSYDANGNTTQITPPGRPAHAFSYTSTDLPATYTPPDVGAGANSTSYSYNLDQQLTQITRPDGKTIAYAYDTGGRVETVTIPRGQLQYTYSITTGNLKAIAAPGGETLSMTYDGTLLTKETWSGSITGVISRTYDNDFRVTAYGINGAAPIAMQYDNDNLLTAAGALVLNRNLQNGLLEGTQLGSVVDSWSYNSFGEPTSYAASFGGAALYTVQHGYDQLGRIVTKTETISGLAADYRYRYDVSDRLAGVDLNNTPVTTYTYDANGNRLSYSSAGSTLTGSYDNQDRLLQYGSATYSYTANGELLGKTENSQTTAYQYDVFGNLIAATLPDGTQLEYVIDGNNRRIGKKVNGALVQGFLYQDDLNPVAELDGSGAVVSRFIYGARANIPDYMLRGGVTYRLIADHLGSPRLVVDVATGTIAQRLDYDEFGNILQDTNPGFQPFGFAGGLYDQHTGLTRFGARDYDAEVGRWTAKDPIGFEGGATSFYTYAHNDPVNLIDIEGEFAEAAAVVIAGGVGSTVAIGAAFVGSTAIIGYGIYKGVEWYINYSKGRPKSNVKQNKQAKDAVRKGVKEIEKKIGRKLTDKEKIRIKERLHEDVKELDNPNFKDLVEQICGDIPTS